MLKIVGIGVGAAVALMAVLSPVAFADDNTKEYEPQVCGNQPFEGLALGFLGHDAFEKADKHNKHDDCDDQDNSHHTSNDD